MRFKIVAGIFVLVAGLLVGRLIGSESERAIKTSRDCWPISHSQSTGIIRCWSGGELVYENSIYHNGGVLCSASGKEIKITGGKSLCVIESSQSDNWTPPTK